MLDRDELVRYNRQLLIPDFGEEGQKKLKSSHVVIAGVGGLGCVSATYLTAAGVGYHYS
jgi:adenylyltransferase/sulfurtransferase